MKSALKLALLGYNYSFNSQIKNYKQLYKTPAQYLKSLYINKLDWSMQFNFLILFDINILLAYKLLYPQVQSCFRNFPYTLFTHFYFYFVGSMSDPSHNKKLQKSMEYPDEIDMVDASKSNKHTTPEAAKTT